jgi:hypothetical protein
VLTGDEIKKHVRKNMREEKQGHGLLKKRKQMNKLHTENKFGVRT